MTSSEPKKTQKIGIIDQISVAGFKSINQEQSLEIRELTILAGANSSGKSSIIQPLLLMKQTIESPYDPGPLLLHGANAKFTSTDQLLSKNHRGHASSSFEVAVSTASGTLRTRFKAQKGKGLVIEAQTSNERGNEVTLREGINAESAIRSAFSGVLPFPLEGSRISVVRDRCFLKAQVEMPESNGMPGLGFGVGFASAAESAIRQMIHLPGLRGTPERTYPVSAIGANFPGTFENYAASLLVHWETQAGKSRLSELAEDMKLLGLTWKVRARRINDTQVEIEVGRLTKAAPGGAHDLVSIADVGFGISQTLPVVVALHAAVPGQMVYLEQPEIHLHPRAQFALAEVLVKAAARGVRLIVETHSSLLLLGLQSLVAEGGLIKASQLKLHWFSRDETGQTHVTSADMDDTGTFGEWPEDFGTVALDAEERFLSAVSKVH
jgi:predicted ATPase